MNRIAIIGNAGGGKSTLARRLSEQLNIPLFEVDLHQFQPGWARTPLDELAAQHEQWLAHPNWIIDGWGGWDNIEKRFSQADAIVLVDFPFWQHLWWTTKRHVLAILGLYPHWPPPGCKPWPITKYLYQVMWMIQREMLAHLVSLVYQFDGQARIVHLRSPRQMKMFLLEIQRYTNHNSSSL